MKNKKNININNEEELAIFNKNVEDVLNSFSEDKVEGLTSSEVNTLISQGKINVNKNRVTKTIPQILVTNIFTLFNTINIFIAICLAVFSLWKDILFIFIIIINTVIGIYQEIHAKRLVDKLSLLNKSKTKVIRDGKISEIEIDQIVLGDYLLLESGMQVPADCILLSESIEVNESMLTGESDSVYHKKGDELLSGSSIISGRGYCKVIRVGADSYSEKIASETKKLKKLNSDLLKSMKKVTFISTLCIIPLGIALFLEGYFLRVNQSLPSLVQTTSASLLGMLPKGLVLLTSISLASGVIKLSKKKILIQDIYSLEGLSHVDTICLDKTGTITTGQMKVDKLFKMNDDINIENDILLIKEYFKRSEDNNQTSLALKQFFNSDEFYSVNKDKDIVKTVISSDSKDNITTNYSKLKVLNTISFNSKRKFSLIRFSNDKAIVVGAFEKLFSNQKYRMKQYTDKGKRVLGIGLIEVDSKSILNKNYDDVKLGEIFKLDEEYVKPLFGVVLDDIIRDKAKETIKYFQQEGVDVKIISGDNLDTVSSIGKKIGLDVKGIDLSSIDERVTSFKDLVNDYNVFTRVTPKQKKLLVDALHENNKRVAMTGDGVNDLLALKEADCSITISDASDAAKQISQVVLLNSDFKDLPSVLLEGRRVVNNVSRSASVFFIKTIYSAMLSLVCLLFNIPFPFAPFMITVVDAACEAYPSFLTIFDPSYEKVKRSFFPNVLKNALPNAVTITLFILITLIFKTSEELTTQEFSTLCYFILLSVTIKAVISSCRPFTKWRIFVCVSMVLGLIFGIVVLPNLLSIVSLNEHILFSTVMVFSSVVISICAVYFGNLIYTKKYDETGLKRVKESK